MNMIEQWERERLVNSYRQGESAAILMSCITLAIVLITIIALVARKGV